MHGSLILDWLGKVKIMFCVALIRTDDNKLTTENLTDYLSTDTPIRPQKRRIHLFKVVRF